jgi:hypothetical protein
MNASPLVEWLSFSLSSTADEVVLRSVIVLLIPSEGASSAVGSDVDTLAGVGGACSAAIDGNAD